MTRAAETRTNHDSVPATDGGYASEVASIVANLAHSDPHDSDGFCHHCGMLPLTRRDVHNDDGPYVIIGRFTHRPDCLWVRARAAAHLEAQEAP